MINPNHEVVAFYIMPSAFRLPTLFSFYNNTMPSALKMNCHGTLASGYKGKLHIARDAKSLFLLFFT
jgi:hypothetical protein